MNISSRIMSAAQTAVAAIRRAFACCFPCCCGVSNTEETPETNGPREDIERPPSQAGSDSGDVVAQLAAYQNPGFQTEDETQQPSDQPSSPDSSSTAAEAHPAPEPEPVQVLPSVEPPIMRQEAVLLGTGVVTGSQDENTNTNTDPQNQTADTNHQPSSSADTGAAASAPAPSTPESPTTPSPPTTLPRIQSLPPEKRRAPAPPVATGKSPKPVETPPAPLSPAPVQPSTSGLRPAAAVRSRQSSPEPGTSASAEVRLPVPPPQPRMPEPKEDRLISVRGLPKQVLMGTEELDASKKSSSEMQKTLFAVTRDRKILNKRQKTDPTDKADQTGAVAEAKAELGFIPQKPEPTNKKKQLSTEMQQKLKMFEEKTAEPEKDESDGGKGKKDGPSTSGQGKKSS